MIKKWCIQNKYSIFVMLLLFCLGGYNLAKSYGFVLFPDEFGYWTYAAQIAGYDWSDIVSLGSYYSYGYSLILFPIFMLCKNAVLAYRVALAVNFILLIAGFFIWKKLAGKLFCGKEENTLVFYTAIALLYPGWLFYARTTLAEIVLVTLYAAICLLLYDYLEHNRMSTLILLVLALVYIHFVHMRAVAVLIAGGLTLILYLLVKGKRLKQCLILLGVLLLIFGAGYWLKEWITGNIYATSEKTDTNDYAGQVGKLAYIFTKEGFENLIVSVAGKVLYLGIASFGLAYWGIMFAGKQVWQAVRDWRAEKEITADKWFYLFVLLATAGATMVNAIYTVGPGRVDALTYGRYHEYVLPVLMILGLKGLENRKKVYLELVAMLFLETVMTALVTGNLQTYGQTNLHGYMMVGMGYLYEAESFDPISFYWKTFLLGAVLTVLVTTILRWVNGHKHLEILMVFILALELVLAVRAGNIYIDDSALGAYRDTKIVERIERLRQDKEREIYYLHDGEYAMISILQFMMRDADIKVIKDESRLWEETGVEDILVTDYQYEAAPELEEKYEYSMINGHFILFYND